MRNASKGYKDLKVWEKSVFLVEEIYKLVSGFPKSEMFSMSSQIRRAASSVPANIAEGSARKSKKEFIRFLSIAYGSLAELESHIIVSKRVGLINDKSSKDILLICDEIAKMICGLINYLESKL